MRLEFQCPTCRRTYRPHPDRVGKRLRCRCGFVFRLLAPVLSPDVIRAGAPMRRPGIDAMGSQLRDLEEDLMPASSTELPPLPLDYLGAPESLELNIDIAQPPAMQLPAPSFEVEVDSVDTELGQPPERPPTPASESPALHSAGDRPTTLWSSRLLTVMLIALWVFSACYAAGVISINSDTAPSLAAPMSPTPIAPTPIAPTPIAPASSISATDPGQ